MDQRRDLVNGMDDPESIRQRGLDAADETLHMLRQRQEEQEQRLHASGARMRPTDAPQGRAGEPEWQPPTLGPAEPVRRAVERRERPAPAPPLATRISHTQHDAAGRISQVSTFEGNAATAAATWETWTRRLVRETSDGLAAGIGEGVMEVFKAEREKTDKIVAELTRRIAMLEEMAGSRQSEEFRNAAD